MRRGAFLGVLLATELVWLLLAAFAPSADQTKVWNVRGLQYLSDYFMPRNTAAHANPYREAAHTLEFAFLRGGEMKEGPGWDLEERDRAYPPGALLPLLPFAESLAGAQACNAVMIGLFVVVLAACLWGEGLRGGPGAVLLAGLLLSGPLLFAYERGNPIWYAAAGTLVFLLFWDHPRRAVRILAAGALAVAASVKVMPAVLGVVYLAPIWEAWRQRRVARPRVAAQLADPAICLLLVAAAFVVPWFFVAGFESFGDWWRTGHANVAWYAPRTSFGFVKLYRAAMNALGREWTDTLGFALARAANGLCGCAALALAVRNLPRSRYAGAMLATTGLLLVGANMQPYTALYLVPAFILWLKENPTCRPFEAAAWLVVWTPLQFPGTHLHTYALQAAALLALAAKAVKTEEKFR